MCFFWPFEQTSSTVRRRKCQPPGLRPEVTACGSWVFRPVLTRTDVDASDDGKVAAVLVELAMLRKSVSGDYEPAGSSAD